MSLTGVRKMCSRFTVLTCAAAAIALSSSPAAHQASHDAPPGRGFVYVMTNDPARNSILQFRNGTDGRLTLEDRQATGGRGGTGNGVGAVDPLGSNDSLVINGDGSRLLAVNAGSDDVSVIGVTDRGIALLGKARSGGDFPTSVALRNNLV